MTACSFSCFTVAKLMLLLPSRKDKVKVTSIDLAGGRGLCDHPRLMIATLTGRTGGSSLTTETCRLVWPDLNIGAATKPFLALICADGFVLRFKPVSVPIKETRYRDAEKREVLFLTSNSSSSKDKHDHSGTLFLGFGFFFYFELESVEKRTQGSQGLSRTRENPPCMEAVELENRGGWDKTKAKNT
ncbi:hypothetical protein PIB30_041336 [Stylosanthes scabra]|uniref:Uncharacterized protein n=1 Tax=Stylosanthes scabra TaxID=79078 RepID=A0ABU6WEX3_9FABA|nr:hypothetical protein [Stylosanthes scabra]